MKQLIFLLFTFSILSNLAAQNTKFKSGDKVPKIKFTDVKGKTYKLKSFAKQEKKLLLCFMRPVWCPVCNQRTHELIKNYANLKEKGYEVVVVYPSPKTTMKEYAKDLNIPFIVVSDYEEKLFKAFNIEKSKKKIIAFNLNEQGRKRMKEGKKLFSKEYSQKGDQHGPIVPADFVIDTDFNFLNIYYGEYMGDHLPVDTL